MGLRSIVENKLPGYNCGRCGYDTCKKFKSDLIKHQTQITKCPFMRKGSSPATREGIRLAKRLDTNRSLVDNLPYDFKLKPLDGEQSCRERVLPLTPKDTKVGDYIRYRPIGCPITHFAHVIEYKEGLLTIHLVGCRLDVRYKDIGLCMVIGFEGIVEGKLPKVCQTVVFVPERCQMGKVHSGVVTLVEGRRIKIELIDLKVFKR